MPSLRFNDVKLRSLKPPPSGQTDFWDTSLNGGFYDPESDNSRWERLKYRGVHLVEAFVIRKRGEVLVGQSEPFRVMIE
jgi:hypothetical protein